MDHNDVIADLALKELAKRERLKAIISQPAYQYYLKGGILGILAGAAGIAFILWLLVKDRVPAWGFMAIALAFIAFIETGRQRERLNAFIELREIENQK